MGVWGGAIHLPRCPSPAPRIPCEPPCGTTMPPGCGCKEGRDQRALGGGRKQGGGVFVSPTHTHGRQKPAQTAGADAARTQSSAALQDNEKIRTREVIGASASVAPPPRCSNAELRRRHTRSRRGVSRDAQCRQRRGGWGGPVYCPRRIRGSTPHPAPTCSHQQTIRALSAAASLSCTRSTVPCAAHAARP